MKKLKKLSNYLLMISGIVTALSGIVNTSIDMVGKFTTKSEETHITQTIHGVPEGATVSKTLEVNTSLPGDTIGEDNNALASADVLASTQSVNVEDTRNGWLWGGLIPLGLVIMIVTWKIHKSGKLDEVKEKV